MTSESKDKGLDRYLSARDAWAIAFGCMVGWGAFVMPGTTFLPLAGPVGTVLSMLISVVIILIIATNFSWLMMRSPRTGGIYSYVKEAFGRDHAFLCSWFICLSYLSIVFLNGTALFVVVRTMTDGALETGFYYTIAGHEIYLIEVLISAAALMIIGVLFIVAKPFIQKAFTVLAAVLIIGAVITAICCLPGAAAHIHEMPFGSSGLSRPYAIFTIVILAPWAFVGFDVISFDTAHFKFQLKRSKRIIFVAVVLAGFVYGAMALVSIAAVPDGYAGWSAYFADLDRLDGVLEVPTFYAARAIMGTPGLIIMGVTAVAAILTGIIGAYRAALRVLSTMAEDRILSEKFSETTYSILFIMVISILLSLLGRNTLNWFIDLTTFGAVVGFGYTSAAAARSAKAENRKDIRLTGFIGMIITAAFGIALLVPRLTAIEAMGGAAFLGLSLWCLLGFVYYWRTINQSTLSEYSGLSTSGIVLFALLVYGAVMWLAKFLVIQESLDAVRHWLVRGGIILIAIIFVGLIVMLYIQDLLRRKHEALEREKIRAVEGSLAKSQFLFNMSHDIRTPMNAIIGYTHLAMKEKSSPEVQEYLTKIETSSRHLLALINDILEMSRIESGKIELEYVPADLCDIFEEMHALFSEQMKQKNMDFQIHISRVTDRYVWCDRKNLNRVLLNLLSNAYKFTPDGGQIAASLIQIGAEENGYGAYEIQVRDTGIGMSREFVEKMFNAFERERTSTVSGIEGTGLGLAITKSLVDLMGGTIEVLTSPGSGTQMIIRIKFRLAQADDIAAAKKNSVADHDPEIDFSTKRLLLVEDNLVNMEIANMILTQAGFQVETAENGQIAVDMVKKAAQGYYDAILMDIQMPVMDGYTAARAIRALPDKAKAQIPILAMTANAFKEDEQAAKDAGMQAHIAKPIDVDLLIKNLSSVLQKET